jgi:Prp8 binding protein
MNAVDRTLAGGTELLVTASDDGTVNVWEAGTEGEKHPVVELTVGCPVTAVCWGADGNTVYAGALDNEIRMRIFVSYYYFMLQFLLIMLT